MAQVHLQLGNPVHTGRAEPRVRHASKLVNAKDGSAHEWDIAESFRLKQELADVMDEFPETNAWGLNDLRPVKFQPYAFELTTEKPITIQALASHG